MTQTTQILWAKDAQNTWLAETAARLKAHQPRAGRPAGFRTVLIGENPASQIYVQRKITVATSLGIVAKSILIKDSEPLENILHQLKSLNDDPTIDAILVQRPLKNIPDEVAAELVTPEKDVDGLHPLHLGKIFSNGRREKSAFVPGTPLGILRLLQHYQIPLLGKHAVIIGRSPIVGKPMAAVLLAEDMTVTLAHSKTKDLAKLARTADLLICAAGVPHLVDASFVHPEMVLIDVGMHRDTSDGKLIGDTHFQSLLGKVKAISPVPGGVGPMTISGLMANVAQAYIQNTYART